MTKRIALNASRMKNMNYRRVLEELRISPFSRSELSRRMGLTRAAISQIVDALIAGGLLIEGDTVVSRSAGRAPTQLHWNPDAFYCAGVFIRRDYFGVALFDFLGGMIHWERRDIAPPFSTEATIMAEICRILDMAIAVNRPKGAFLGIGIGAPGPLNSESGIIDNPTNLEILHKTPIVDILKQRYRCPVIMANDASANALAELRRGVKDRYESFMVIEVTGGIGAGLVLEGQLITGSAGNGNEIGHTTLNVFGPRCQCGNIGCAELYASMDVIEAKAAKIDPSLKSWPDIVDAALEGSEHALGIVQEEALYLATLAVNALNTFKLDAVIFAGRRLCYKPETLLGMIRQQIPGRLLIKEERPIDIIASTLTNNADAQSAANLVIEHFLRTFDETAYV